MPINILAKHVFVEEDEDGVQVWFASDCTEKAIYLTFQYLHKYDEQDINLGMGKPYIEINDQINGQYGGIKVVEYTDNNLTFYFDETSNIAKRVGQIFTIQICETPHQLQKIILELLKFSAKNKI